MAQAIEAPTLDRAAIEALSKAAAEPVWLLEARLRAFDRWSSLPPPTERTEGWRRLRFDYGAVSLTDRSHPDRRPEISSASRGVVACRLHDALQDHADVLRQVLADDAQRPISLHKEASLLDAGWQEGAFVRFPDGIESGEPVRIEYHEPPFNRTVIVVGRGARATVVERHTETWGFGLAATDIVLGEGAHLSFAFVQEAGSGTTFFSMQRARIGRDAKLTTLNFAAGGSFAKTDVAVSLRGQGAESDMLGVVFGESNQQFDVHTLQGHMASDTRSDLLYKSALDDESHSIYTGVISIDKNSPRSEAYQANRNLLLSSGARADTQPKLEILIDDVTRCTHGATVGPVDDEQLFYLRTRGLDADRATRLIVEGFFRDVFERFGNDAIAAELASKVAPHIDRLGVR